MKILLKLTILIPFLISCSSTQPIATKDTLSAEVTQCVNKEMKKIKSLNKNPNLILNINKDAIISDCKKKFQ
jgi:hypothetical protein